MNFSRTNRYKRIPKPFREHSGTQTWKTRERMRTTPRVTLILKQESSAARLHKTLAQKSVVTVPPHRLEVSFDYRENFTEIAPQPAKTACELPKVGDFFLHLFCPVKAPEGASCYCFCACTMETRPGNGWWAQITLNTLSKLGKPSCEVKQAVQRRGLDSTLMKYVNNKMTSHILSLFDQKTKTELTEFFRTFLIVSLTGTPDGIFTGSPKKFCWFVTFRSVSAVTSVLDSLGWFSAIFRFIFSFWVLSCFSNLQNELAHFAK